ncbi:MAG: HAD-IIB family hydrolase [Fuerstiella sp.]|nr:HAD-IIB family hydrolase [Fuerstiella sp.]
MHLDAPIALGTDSSFQQDAADESIRTGGSHPGPLKICLISLHGLIRAREPELGKDADTGGQVAYVLELARQLSTMPNVAEVELLTRQVIDPRIDDDYARLEETITDKARIVRIPFGPKRYLRKESLWPYLEMFIDQTLIHFRRFGVPDVIHGHYADAGLAGAQLARLLHVPFVFTGHSLGRVKRQRLSMGKSSPESLEKKYRLRTRIEAEEVALETASMVVTSTSQEVCEQYELYDHYVPSRMEVIPPGVDLSRFYPVRENLAAPVIADKLANFLSCPDKQAIITIARPDERKNLEALVRVYGESHQLQNLANLVLVMGTRDDLGQLPKAQRTVIENILYLIDRYDLYGKVAYPKTHVPDDVPALYRWASGNRGVFINPALTEPFGLTLLEAGATGLPVVATNNGGPGDIIANCQNGLLVDVTDDKAIECALLRALTEPDEWVDWSHNGIRGTRQHYSWENHVGRYLRDVTDIVSHSRPPEAVNRRARRLPEFDRLIITDLDNTLTGDSDSLSRFIALIRENDHIGFGIATGRRLDSARELIDELGLPMPDLIDTDVGTQLHYGENLTEDRSWQKSISYAWKPDEIRAVLNPLPGVFPQIEHHQSAFKISYEIDAERAPGLADIKQTLRESGLRAKVVLSHGMFLDIIPVRGGTDLSMRHVLWKWGFTPENVLVAGDSGNDAGMLLGRTLGVVVGNHSAELDRLADRPRVYFAAAHHAAGILEGISYYNFLDQIVIPNDRTES